MGKKKDGSGPFAQAVGNLKQRKSDMGAFINDWRSGKEVTLPDGTKIEAGGNRGMFQTLSAMGKFKKSWKPGWNTPATQPEASAVQPNTMAPGQVTAPAPAPMPSLPAPRPAPFMSTGTVMPAPQPESSAVMPASNPMINQTLNKIPKAQKLPYGFNNPSKLY